MKPKTQLGFTLTETIIYIFLSSVFFLLLFQFAAYNYVRYSSKRETYTKKANIWVALDILGYDARKISSLGYKKYQKNEIIFSTNSYDVGWKFNEGNLYRITGKYNNTNESWSETIESIAVKDIEKIEFNISKDQKLLNIIIEFKVNNVSFKIEYYISSRIEQFLFPVI